ncbi:MAG: molecular chaperone DnaJ [Cyanothece sp. SIO1E1]|nr:molecular chaperone DnaJ [Cyanothece sp. SIO1E1]
MSEQNSYEKLGLSETSSFDEIQAARNRLVEEHEGDRKQVETIEAAYDAILMERLRLRQEGKIKVPDRIRYAEKLTEPPTHSAPAPSKQTPEWLKQLLDTPSRNDVLWPGVLFAGLGVLSIASPGFLPMALALGVGLNLYFLNRKERKFGRSLLLTLISLFAGLTLGAQLGSLLAPQFITNFGLTNQVSLEAVSNSVAAIVTFIIFWLVSSFLK